MFPRRCVCCDRVLSLRERYCCNSCEGSLRYIGGEYCLRCGKPVDEGEEYCADCRKRNYTFQCGRAAFLYDAKLRDSIARFKYHGRQEYAAFYGRAMYERWGDWLISLAPDALLPVPIHRERRRKRGFNQAELVAAELGKRCKIPVVSDYLVRIRNTLPQKELSDRERMANLSQAFSVRSTGEELYKSLNCVIIIDDIYTTGSTMEACSQVLYQNGIKDIYFMCICIGEGY